MNASALLSSLRTMMNDYGEVVTFRQATTGTYDPATGSMSGGSNTDHSVIAFYFNSHPTEVLQGTVSHGRRRIAVYAKKTDGTDLPTPKTKDQIVGFGDEAEIADVQVVRSNGTPMVYLLRILD